MTDRERIEKQANYNVLYGAEKESFIAGALYENAHLQNLISEKDKRIAELEQNQKVAQFELKKAIDLLEARRETVTGLGGPIAILNVINRMFTGDSKLPENDREKLRIASEPLLKYLEHNWHPHATIIVTQDGVELMIGQLSIQKLTTP